MIETRAPLLSMPDRAPTWSDPGAAHRGERRAVATVVALALAALLPSPSPADSERDLNRRWQGAWVIVGAAVSSSCDALYTNNEVRGDLVVGKGRHRFQAGELAHVHKVSLERRRVEVFLDLGEGLLVPYRDGPFELYRELGCKVEVRIPVADRRPAALPGEEIDSILAALVERHTSAASATASAAWNGRLRVPYPEGYDETLAEYGVWKAEQVNAAVQAKLEESIEEAARIVDDVDEDPEYLSGFAEGIEEAREKRFGDCEELLSRSVIGFAERAPRDASRQWREGFEAGQELVFYLEIGRRLRRCFVPVPE